MGALLGREAGGGAAEERDDLALHVDALVIVAAEAGDAIADEHNRRGQLEGGLVRIARGQIILLEHESDGLAALAGERHAALVRGLVADQRHLLEIRAFVAGGPQALLVELRCDVLRGDIVFGAARLTAAHLVRGEEHDVALERRLIGGKLGVEQRVVLGGGPGGCGGGSLLRQRRSGGEHDQAERRSQSKHGRSLKVWRDLPVAARNR